MCIRDRLSDALQCRNDQFMLNVASDAADKSDDESEKFVPLSEVGRKKHTPTWYGRRIAKFGRAGKVGKAYALVFISLSYFSIVLINSSLYC